MFLIRFSQNDDLEISESEIEKLSVDMEKEMFNMCYTTDEEYTNKYQHLVLALKDPQNKVVFVTVILLKCLTLVQPFVHFSFVFFDNFACVYANCINLVSGVYFYWNFNIPPSFPLINLFCTRYKKVNHQDLLDLSAV